MHFSVLFLCSLPPQKTPKISAKLRKKPQEKNQNLVGTGVLGGPPQTIPCKIKAPHGNAVGLFYEE
jgi:hypothetical protein